MTVNTAEGRKPDNMRYLMKKEDDTETECTVDSGGADLQPAQDELQEFGALCPLECSLLWIDGRPALKQ